MTLPDVGTLYRIRPEVVALSLKGRSFNLQLAMDDEDDVLSVAMVEAHMTGELDAEGNFVVRVVSHEIPPPKTE